MKHPVYTDNTPSGLESEPRTIVALIQKRGDFGNRHFVTRTGSESAHDFKVRMEKCYPFPTWEIDFVHAHSIDID